MAPITAGAFASRLWSQGCWEFWGRACTGSPMAFPYLLPYGALPKGFMGQSSQVNPPMGIGPQPASDLSHLISEGNDGFLSKTGNEVKVRRWYPLTNAHLGYPFILPLRYLQALMLKPPTLIVWLIYLGSAPKEVIWELQPLSPLKEKDILNSFKATLAILEQVHVKRPLKVSLGRLSPNQIGQNITCYWLSPK